MAARSRLRLLVLWLLLGGSAGCAELSGRPGAESSAAEAPRPEPTADPQPPPPKPPVALPPKPADPPKRAAVGNVRHEPATPKPGEAVLVTAELPAGASRVTLKLQAVAPGKYVRKNDPEYEKDWTDLPMGEGKDGDGK